MKTYSRKFGELVSKKSLQGEGKKVLKQIKQYEKYQLENLRLSSKETVEQVLKRIKGRN